MRQTDCTSLRSAVTPGLSFMHGCSDCRCAILIDDDGSYVQAGGSGMTCCLERRNMTERRHFRAFQHPPVVPWPGTTELYIISGTLSLQQEEFFRIAQVEEAFLAFLRREPFPDYIQWRDLTEEIDAGGNRCDRYEDKAHHLR